MGELRGWLLDVYAKKQDLTLWFIGEEGSRYQLRQDFPVTFYAAGTNKRLRELWRFVSQQPIPVRLFKTERQDLFSGPRQLLAIRGQDRFSQFHSGL